MNKHLNDGQLRAALDGELSPDERQHLEICPACQTRQQTVEAQVQRAARRLAFLSAEPGRPVPAPRAALMRFQEQNLYPKENSIMNRLFASPLFRFGIAFVLILALVVAIPTTRALADQLLNLFRVQQVTVVPIDFTGMQQLTGDSTFGKQISSLLSRSITMTQKPQEPVNVADVAQASQLTGFNVRLPQGMTPSRITVEKGAAFTFKVDRAKAQALLDEAGRNDLVLPQAVDGADIAVTIPAGVSVGYGVCPDPTVVDEGPLNLGGGSAGRNYPNCVMLAEIPSPTVKAPASVDVAQLAQIGLEFTGMTPEQAKAFTDTVDWTSSLVVPIPKNAATYKQVPVDGVTGTLIQRPADDAPQYALLWVKNGIIYAIGGLGSDSAKAIEMANSLK